MEVTAAVELLSRGRGRFETMRSAYNAGPTAVLSFGNVTMVVISETVGLIDRSLYYARGLDPGIST